MKGRPKPARVVIKDGIMYLKLPYFKKIVRPLSEGQRMLDK